MSLWCVYTSRKSHHHSQNNGDWPVAEIVLTIAVKNLADHCLAKVYPTSKSYLQAQLPLEISVACRPDTLKESSQG